MNGAKKFEDRTVAAAYLGAMYRSALDMGVPRENLIDIPGFDENGLRIGIKRYPVGVFLELLQRAATFLNNDSIGIELGLRLRPERRIDVLYALTFCRTLKESLTLNLKYQPLIQQIGITELENRGDVSALVWKPHLDRFEGQAYVTGAVFAGYVSIGKWLLWSETPPSEQVRFRHSAPDDRSAYVTAFGDSLVFDAECDEIIFKSSELENLLPGRNPEMVRRLHTRLDQMLLGLTHSSLSGQAKALIAGALKDGQATGDFISHQLGMSERTLRRKLSREGTNFSQLIIQCRQEMADIFLADPKMPLTEIAHALGFNDQSAFSRAFREWEGVPPSVYRQNLPVIE